MGPYTSGTGTSVTSGDGFKKLCWASDFRPRNTFLESKALRKKPKKSLKSTPWRAEKLKASLSVSALQKPQDIVDKKPLFKSENFKCKEKCGQFGK